ESRLRKTVLAILYLLLPILVLSACYLFFNYENISSVLPKKMSLTNLTEDLINRPEFLHHHETPLYIGDETYLWVIFKILNIFIGTCPHIFFVFLVFGIVKRRLFPYSIYNELPCLLLFVLSCLMMALFVLFFSGYVSRRHFAPIAVISLPWVSVGILEIEIKLKKWLAFAARNLQETGIIFYVMLSAIFIISFFKLCIPIGADKIGERKAGEWILSEFSGKQLGFLTNISRVAYYAGAYERNYNITALPYDNELAYIQYPVIMKFANDCNLDFIVVDNVVDTFAPDFMKKAAHGTELTLIHAPIPKSNSSTETNFIFIYKINK
ncbi:MAG: hypothetical protein HZA48_09885, partial [Planctomycetes bacterium]|nr:hypothetical protein [Planctomycetota bacterium]